MKVLIFNIYFHPEPIGTGMTVGQLALDLADAGDHVTVVTTVPHYATDCPPPRLREGVLRRERWKGMDVWRTYVWTSRRRNVFTRAANYLSYTALSVMAGFLADRPDVVLCVVPPISTGVPAVLCGRLKGVPVVLSVQDVYPDSIFPGRALAVANRTLERHALGAASRVIVISESMKRRLSEQGVRDSKLELIENWTDTDEIRPLPHRGERFRAEHGIDGGFLALYAGNLGVFGGHGVILDAARLLQDRPQGRAIEIVLVGRGARAEVLRKRALDLGLRNVRFLPPQPRERLPEMLAAADIGLVTLDGRLSVTSVPSKTYTYMAAGRPVLAGVHEDNEIARMMASSSCGLRVAPDRPDLWAEALLAAAADPARLSDWGRNGRRYVERHHARSTQTRRYHDVLQEAADCSGR